MAGGGVAFSQALNNQAEAGVDPNEPVVKYGTGGRITHVRRFRYGGDTMAESFMNDDSGGGFGGDFGGDFGGGFGGGDFGGNVAGNDSSPEQIYYTPETAYTAPAQRFDATNDGGAIDLGTNPETGAPRMEFTGMAQNPIYEDTGVSDFGSLDAGPGAYEIPSGGIRDLISENPSTPMVDIPYEPLTFEPLLVGGQELTPDQYAGAADNLTVSSDNPSQEITDFGSLDSGPGAYEIPYDPYTDEGPSQPSTNVTGVDTTLPSAGETTIVDERPTIEIPDYIAPIDQEPPVQIPDYIAPIDQEPPVQIPDYIAPFDTEPPVQIPDYIAPVDQEPPVHIPDYIAPVDEEPTIQEPDIQEPYEPPVDPTEPPVFPPVLPPVIPTMTTPYTAATSSYTPASVAQTAGHSIYQPQYQNYANPLTMFNVSNYGRDVPTSAGYNQAVGPQGMGIAGLNQSLQDFANQQMSQQGGANMNQVLQHMNSLGLSPTDLENSYYGRTSGLNTPFSQYGNQAPAASPASGITSLVGSLPT